MKIHFAPWISETTTAENRSACQGVVKYYILHKFSAVSNEARHCDRAAPAQRKFAREGRRGASKEKSAENVIGKYRYSAAIASRTILPPAAFFSNGCSFSSLFIDGRWNAETTRSYTTWYARCCRSFAGFAYTIKMEYRWNIYTRARDMGFLEIFRKKRERRVPIPRFFSSIRRWKMMEITRGGVVGSIWLLYA